MMRAHPDFAGRTIPTLLALGNFRLRILTIADLAEDYKAVVESAADLKGVFEDGSWPEGLTREEDLVDLGWHQKEFSLKRSFAWIIADPENDAYLGCAYVFPPQDADSPAEAWFWFRTSVRPAVDEAGFRQAFETWLNGPVWPDYRFRIIAPS